MRAQNYRYLHFTLTMNLMISNMYDIYKKECMYIVFCTKIIKYSMLKKGKLWNIMQIYPVSEGYLRKIPVERRGKYPKPL